MNVTRWRPLRGYPENCIIYPVSDNDFIYMVTHATAAVSLLSLYKTRATDAIFYENRIFRAIL